MSKRTPAQQQAHLTKANNSLLWLRKNGFVTYCESLRPRWRIVQALNRIGIYPFDGPPPPHSADRVPK